MCEFFRQQNIVDRHEKQNERKGTVGRLKRMSKQILIEKDVFSNKWSGRGGPKARNLD